MIWVYASIFGASVASALLVLKCVSLARLVRIGIPVPREA